MRFLNVKRPISAGLLLSYKCTGECSHCMYACSPQWNADWIDEHDLARVLKELSPSIMPAPSGPDSIDLNHGLHLTGGEPFMNPGFLLDTVEHARSAGIPSLFAETNCFWCTEAGEVEDTFCRLRDAGLSGMLLSVNPFILERVPFERTEMAVARARDAFGENAIVYQQFFYLQFRAMGIKSSLSFEDYLDRAGAGGLSRAELLPMGRLAYRLPGLFRHFPASYFFGDVCLSELTRQWHIHVDNYCNYIPGFCAGISLGDARNMDRIFGGIDLNLRPVLRALSTGMEELFRLGLRYGYEESSQGYISKCHLCLDIRRHLVEQPVDFKELRPEEFYRRL
jgi:hypothetical protein